MNSKLLITVLPYVLFGILIYVIFKNLKSWGLLPEDRTSQKDIKIDIENEPEKIIGSWSNAFSPTFFKGKKNLITEDEAKSFASQIYDSFGFFNDDQLRIISIIREVPNIQSLSLLTRIYNDKYNEDLSTRLENVFGGRNYDDYGIILNDLIAKK